MGYAVGGLGTSLGCGEVWIGVPVRCYTECNSKSEMGLQSLSQGSQERVWNGESWAGSGTPSSENRTKVCGWMGHAVRGLRVSLGHGEVWIRVPVRCYMELVHTCKQH